MNTETMFFKGGALDPDRHARLVQSLEMVRKQSHVPLEFILHKSTDYCEKDEIEWLMKYKHHAEEGLAGMVFVNDPDATTKMMGLAGMSIRNYIDARFMSLQDVMALAKKGEYPTCTILMIPNFYLPSGMGGSVANWELPNIISLLLDRMADGKTTVLAIQNMNSMKQEYGQFIYDHIVDKYKLFD